MKTLFSTPAKFDTEAELLINAVLHDEASEEQLEQFNRQIDSDEAFEEHFAQALLFHEVVTDPGMQAAVKKALVTSSTTEPIQKRFAVWPVAASFFVAMFIGWWVRDAVDSTTTPVLPSVSIAAVSQTIAGTMRSAGANRPADTIPVSSDTAIVLPFGGCSPTSLTIATETGEVLSEWTGATYPSPFAVVNLRNVEQAMVATAKAAECPDRVWNLSVAAS